MFKHFLFSFALLLCLVFCPSRANWGGGVCGPVGPMAPVYAPAPSYCWRTTPEPDQLALFYGPSQVGIYLIPADSFYPCVGTGWGEPTKPPAALPEGFPKQSASKRCACCGICAEKYCPCNRTNKCCPKCDCNQNAEPVQAEAPLCGVETDKIRPNRHEINGRQVTREAVISALKDIPKDSSNLRLTVIGEDTERQAVLADLKADPALKALTADVLIQDYRPDAWEVKDAGFPAAGHPSVVLQAPDGKILHSQPEYNGGAKALAEAVRKARDDFDPAKAPDLRKTDPLSELKLLLAKLEDVPAVVWLGLGFLVLLYLQKKEGR